MFTANPDTEINYPKANVTVTLKSTIQQADVTVNPDTKSTIQQADVTVNPDTESTIQQADVTVNPDTKSTIQQTDVTVNPDTKSTIQQANVTVNPDTKSTIHQADGTANVTVNPDTESTLSLKVIEKTRKGRPVNVMEIPKRFTAKQTVSAAKNKDLRSCKTGVIPREYNSLYKGLQSDNKTPNILPDPDFEEDEIDSEKE
ncbi:Hypothetical predicted protein [Mytilus galloprovincialis]|uniref:Uncharacterized protein n=1 Tax=Mytilus galloprovincialis TaxID=29158 RepID=A0A8B6C5J7_MYTGA|nr:Hypothetical predicted protein [Mytilus galloprovincialis]